MWYLQAVSRVRISYEHLGNATLAETSLLTHNWGPFSSIPAINSATPNGRDCGHKIQPRPHCGL